MPHLQPVYPCRLSNLRNLKAKCLEMECHMINCSLYSNWRHFVKPNVDKTTGITVSFLPASVLMTFGPIIPVTHKRHQTVVLIENIVPAPGYFSSQIRAFCLFTYTLSKTWASSENKVFFENGRSSTCLSKVQRLKR